MGSATSLDSRLALVECREGILGIIRRQETRKPSCDALAIGRPPLRGSGLSGNFDSLHGCLVRRSHAITRHTHKRAAELLANLRGNGNLLADAVGIGGDDFVVYRLHLQHQPGLVEESAIGHDAHGLRHLEGTDENVTLTDREVGDIAALDGAFVDAHHVGVVRDVSRGLGAKGDACAAAEADALGKVDNGLGPHFETGLVEPGVARLREGLLESKTTGVDFFPVAESVVANGEGGRATECLLGSDATGFETGKSHEGFESGSRRVGRAEGAGNERVSGVV